MLIFRVFAHEEYFFQKTSLLVASKIGIYLTKSSSFKYGFTICEIRKEENHL